MAVPDSQGSIVTDQDVVVATFVRVARPREGKAIVRWVNGEPAATERPLGRGCVREVAVLVDATGDLALRESFRDVARKVAQPCGGLPDYRLAEVPKVDHRDFGEVERAQNMELPAPDAGRLPLLLAIAALATLGAEHILRRRARPVAA
jgi:hypothetical protein